MEINTNVLVENNGFYAKFPTLVTWRPSFFAFPSRWHQINPRESNTCFQGTDGRISLNTTASNHDNLAQDVSTQSTLTALTVRAWLIQASSSCHTWLEALKMLTGHNAPLNQPATKEVSSVTSVAFYSEWGEKKRGIESPCREMTCGTFRIVRSVLSAPAGVGSRFFLYLPEKKNTVSDKMKALGNTCHFPTGIKWRARWHVAHGIHWEFYPLAPRCVQGQPTFQEMGFFPMNISNCTQTKYWLDH
jgi:hypothetical protein